MRELRNVVQRLYVMTDGHVIGDEWLRFRRPAAAAAPPTTPRSRCASARRWPTSERALILATLQRFDNHKEKTAAALGVSLKTLYNRLKDYAQKDDE